MLATLGEQVVFILIRRGNEALNDCQILRGCLAHASGWCRKACSPKAVSMAPGWRPYNRIAHDPIPRRQTRIACREPVCSAGGVVCLLLCRLYSADASGDINYCNRHWNRRLVLQSPRSAGRLLRRNVAASGIGSSRRGRGRVGGRIVASYFWLNLASGSSIPPADAVGSDKTQQFRPLTRSVLIRRSNSAR
jgi:hypothetical protein